MACKHPSKSVVNSQGLFISRLPPFHIHFEVLFPNDLYFPTFFKPSSLYIIKGVGSLATYALSRSKHHLDQQRQQLYAL
eukprot:scaffold431138_cov24-Prasinocladus_malaysianus.AAC.1